MRAVFAGMAAMVLIGCSASNHRTEPTQVTVHSVAATQPAGGNASASREHAGRHVELTVRDPSAAGFSASIVGHECRVQFRRDALGLASNSAVSPTQDWAGRMSLDGKVA